MTRNFCEKLLLTFPLVVTLCLSAQAQKAELAVQTGHASTVVSVEFSPDGKVFASSEFQSTILWETGTGRELRTLPGRSAVFSPDGKTLATLSGQEIHLWNWQTGRQLLVNQAFTSLQTVAFSPSGDVFATVSFSPDLIKLWDVKTGRQLRVLAGHTAMIGTVIFSSDGKTLASEGGGSIKLWNWQTGEQLKTIPAQTASVLSRSLAFSPDGKILAANVSVEGIKLWNVKTATELMNIPAGNYLLSGSIAFSPDGRTLAKGGITFEGDKPANSIRFWDLETRQPIWTIPIEFSLPDRTNPGARPSTTGFSPMAFSPDNKFLTISGDTNPVLWDVTTRRKLREFNGNAAQAISVGVSPDNNLIATGGSRGTIKLWNLQEGRQFQTVQGPTFPVEALAFSNDGKVLASSDAQKTIRLWEIRTGKELRSFSVESPETQKQVEAIVPAFYSGRLDSPSIAGRFGLFLGAGGKLNLHEQNNPTPSVSLVSLGQNDWAVITPDGLFDASAGARRFMHYMTGLESIALEQMKDLYYVPGLLQKVLKGAPLPKVELFGKADLFPRVEFEPHKPNQRQLTVRLTNRGGGIGQVQVLFNDKELLADARPAGFNPNSPNAILTIDLSKAAIKTGEENRIEIIARNAAGSLSTRDTAEAELVFKDESKDPIEPPNIYAIVVGVSDYTGDKLKLNFAAKDAEDFARAIELGAIKLLNGDKSKVHIRLLTSNGDKSGIKFSSSDAKTSTAAKADLAQAFSDFRTATPKDVFIVYLAGHGISLNLNQNPNQAGGDTYLYLTQEATTTDKSVLAVENSRKAMAISSEELKELMKQNKALKQVLILDTCAAGALSKSLVGKRELPSDQIRAIERLKDNTGFFVLMGASADAVSYEASQYGQGLLTYSLLQGLKGARLRENQFADVGLLFGYAQDIVPQMAKNIGGIQRPLIFTPDTSRSFDIGQFTTEEQKQITLSNPRPIILRPNLRNAALRFDNLKLTQMMTEELRRVSYVQARGQQSPIVFVEADEMTDAVQPVGDYTIEGDTLRISVILVKNNTPLGKEITATGGANEPERIIRQLVERLLSGCCGDGTP